MSSARPRSASASDLEKAVSTRARVASASDLEEVSSAKEALFLKSAVDEKKSGYTKQWIGQVSSTAPKPKHGVKKINRAIPSYLRTYIWQRDGGQCAYVHHETKRRCSSRHPLQIDHIQPFALGGKTAKENLRLLCAGHNQDRWSNST